MMKLTKTLFLYGILLFIAFSCEEEENEIPCACNVENPQENIEWLNVIIQNISENGKVYSFYSDNNEYILIEGWIIQELVQIYNCNGELVCQIGGIIGVGGVCDMPVDYWVDFENSKELIYPID